ncbi:homoserine kinase [Helicobacter muridarum]|uniref:Homoserine kinase n=1 Tax=Helicobacter muridarum TaxID=216 RepID=A0A099TYX8_9HELI|nr:homoserine kinase [Helicobacter muridarum]TLE00583.1 homoserine kinase [Helicobacter muridarum]STQ85596.1 homoserine kinase [Helicobacter muridarum]
MHFSVPATSANLGSGFDCLGLSLNFRNHFSITESSEQKIKICGEGERIIKFAENNMFVKIFTKVYTSLGGDSKFHFTFHNKIPISRGLGSSSAIIVGAIFSAYKMADFIPNKQEILNLALQYEKHPDNITPAVMGGFNASLIYNDDNGKNQVMSIRHRIPNSIKAIIVIPNHPMATKKSRSILAKQYSIKDCVYNLSRSCVLSLAFSLNKWELLKESSKDRLHESQRMETFPILFNIKKFALENGALMSSLSGSGSSIFSLCYADEAKKLERKLRKNFPRFRTIGVDFDNDGIKLEKG